MNAACLVHLSLVILVTLVKSCSDTSLQIETLTDVAFQLHVDEPTEAGLSLALSDLRLKVAKLPLENVQKTQRAKAAKAGKLESIEGLSRDEAVLGKAEADTRALEADAHQVGAVFF